MNKKEIKRENNIDWYQVYLNFAIMVLGVGLLITFWSTYKLCKQRQQVLRVVNKAVIYDGWDVYASDSPKVLAIIKSPAEFRVLGIYSSMDSGGVKIKLPNGQLGYTHIFDEETDIDFYQSIDFISISLFFTMIGFLLFICLLKNITLVHRTLLFLTLLLYSISIFTLLNLSWF